MLNILVWLFRFLLVWTLVSVVFTFGLCYYLSTRSERPPPSGRPGDME